MPSLDGCVYRHMRAAVLQCCLCWLWYILLLQPLQQPTTRCRCPLWDPHQWRPSCRRGCRSQSGEVEEQVAQLRAQLLLVEEENGMLANQVGCLLVCILLNRHELHAGLGGLHASHWGVPSCCLCRRGFGARALEGKWGEMSCCLPVGPLFSLGRAKAPMLHLARLSLSSYQEPPPCRLTELSPLLYPLSVRSWLRRRRRCERKRRRQRRRQSSIAQR